MKVFALPRLLFAQVPEFDYTQSIKVYDEKEAAFLTIAGDYFRAHAPNEALVGEEVHFPFADGYARYMVATVRPFQLVHLPLGDAWHYPQVERQTKKDVCETIRARKALAEMFGQRK